MTWNLLQCWITTNHSIPSTRQLHTDALLVESNHTVCGGRNFVFFLIIDKIPLYRIWLRLDHIKIRNVCMVDLILIVLQVNTVHYRIFFLKEVFHHSNCFFSIQKLRSLFESRLFMHVIITKFKQRGYANWPSCWNQSYLQQHLQLSNYIYQHNPLCSSGSSPFRRNGRRWMMKFTKMRSWTLFWDCYWKHATRNQNEIKQQLQVSDPKIILLRWYWWLPLYSL